MWVPQWLSTVQTLLIFMIIFGAHTYISPLSAYHSSRRHSSDLPSHLLTDVNHVYLKEKSSGFTYRTDNISTVGPELHRNIIACVFPASFLLFLCWSRTLLLSPCAMCSVSHTHAMLPTQLQHIHTRGVTYWDTWNLVLLQLQLSRCAYPRILFSRGAPCCYAIVLLVGTRRGT